MFLKFVQWIWVKCAQPKGILSGTRATRHKIAHKRRRFHGKGGEHFANVRFVKCRTRQAGQLQACEQLLQGGQIGYGQENQVVGMQVPTREATCG